MPAAYRRCILAQVASETPQLQGFEMLKADQATDPDGAGSALQLSVADETVAAAKRAWYQCTQ
ncbi:hypothetical protein FHY11_002022 [Xanthomonas arboricola]|uniref:hypothetical protein n=1 Tax=Xanthomonas euroxanthea TaxID=2259622 RepID=UPI00141B2A28|nr:hypothetical protein [Xanthomonas euroxanthea]NIK08512.1 hypothetical protein [Xanthomonas euroxanthea]